LELSGLTGKLTGALEKNGELIGIGAGLLLPQGPNNIIYDFEHIQELHFPHDIGGMITEYFVPETDAGRTTWMGVGLWVGGYIAKEMDFGLERLGRAAEKIGKGILEGNAIQLVLRNITRT
jgi:hypothetical protein